jgi:CHAT domain-containing protein
VTSTDKVFWEAKKLYEERLAPAASHLDGIARLIVIPSVYMRGIPVEVLLNEENRFVGDVFTVSYVSSGTVYAWLREHAREFFVKDALIVGDPYLSAAETKGVSSFPNLPASASEVARLASLLHGCVTLSGEQASEQKLVELAGSMRSFGTVHISTHACVDPEHPQRSYLALSQANLPDPLECALAGTRIYDGKLTLHEIVREWRLDADLVTLSACQTAMGKEAKGEGVVGFAYAFLQAGARSVVVSLWEVDDEATSMLMGRFYENLTGAYSGERMRGCRGPMSKTAALSEAKRWLRGYTDESGRTPFRHPAYWSAFILVGDPG